MEYWCSEQSMKSNSLCLSCNSNLSVLCFDSQAGHMWVHRQKTVDCGVSYRGCQLLTLCVVLQATNSFTTLLKLFKTVLEKKSSWLLTTTQEFFKFTQGFVPQDWATNPGRRYLQAILTPNASDKAACQWAYKFDTVGTPQVSLLVSL